MKEITIKPVAIQNEQIIKGLYEQEIVEYLKDKLQYVFKHTGKDKISVSDCHKYFKYDDFLSITIGNSHYLCGPELMLVYAKICREFGFKQIVFDKYESKPFDYMGINLHNYIGKTGRWFDAVHYDGNFVYITNGYYAFKIVSNKNPGTFYVSEVFEDYKRECVDNSLKKGINLIKMSAKKPDLKKIKALRKDVIDIYKTSLTDLVEINGYYYSFTHLEKFFKLCEKSSKKVKYYTSSDGTLCAVSENIDAILVHKIYGYDIINRKEVR